MSLWSDAERLPQAVTPLRSPDKLVEAVRVARGTAGKERPGSTRFQAVLKQIGERH
jgi:hypothetical protein